MKKTAASKNKIDALPEVLDELPPQAQLQRVPRPELTQLQGIPEFSVGSTFPVAVILCTKNAAVASFPLRFRAAQQQLLFLALGCPLQAEGRGRRPFRLKAGAGFRRRDGVFAASLSRQSSRKHFRGRGREAAARAEGAAAAAAAEGAAPAARRPLKLLG